jgi:DNA-directed RNA polymerase specialized sigma24 family protein
MSVITESGEAAVEGRDRRRRRRGPSPASDGQPPEPHQGRRRQTPVSPALRQRLDLLPTRDRAIVELTMRANLSRTGIARALGSTPGQVSRRLRVLYARLHDPLVVAMCDARCPLAPEYRQLGIEHFLLGVKATELAEKHRLAVPEVRRMLVYLRGWQRGVTGRG